MLSIDILLTIWTCLVIALLGAYRVVGSGLGAPVAGDAGGHWPGPMRGVGGSPARGDVTPRP